MSGFSLSDFGAGATGGLFAGAGQGLLRGVQSRFQRFGDPTKDEKLALERARKDYQRAENIYNKMTSREQERYKTEFDELGKTLGEKLESFEKSQRKADITGVGTFPQRMGTATKELFGDSLLRNVLGAKGLLAVVSGIFASIVENLEVISSLSQETGMFAESISEEYSLMARRSAELIESEEQIYTRVSERFTIMVNLRRQMGDILAVSDRTLDTIANFPNVIGLSNDEAVTLLTTLRDINGRTVEFNTELIKSMAIISDRNVVAFRDLMDDVQNNAEFFATYSGNGTDELLKASVYARRIGLDLGLVAGILDNFTGIESSIESQARLSAVLGENFDFLRISSQMFHGETMQATQTLLDALRQVSEEQFNMPFIRQQLSQELGVSVTELNRLYRSAKKFQDEDVLIDMRISEEMEEFNDMFNQLGFGRIRQTFVTNVVSPLSNLLSDNKDQVASFIDLVTKLISGFGSVTMGFIKVGLNIIDGLNDMFDFMDRLFGKDGTFGRAGALIVGITSLVGIAQTIFHLMNRNSVLLSTQVAEQRNTTNAILKGSILRNPQTKGIGRGARFGYGALGAMGLASLGAQRYTQSQQEDKRFETSGLLGQMGSGALMGLGTVGLLPIPFARTAGLALGAGAGALSYMSGVDGQMASTRDGTGVDGQMTSTRDGQMTSTRDGRGRNIQTMSNTVGHKPESAKLSMDEKSADMFGKSVAKYLRQGDTNIYVDRKEFGIRRELSNNINTA